MFAFEWTLWAQKEVFMGLMDHLEKLDEFRAIAEMGSFHKAAAQLHISQPSLSNAIKSLEEALGKKLFRRSYKGVTLTPEGEAVFEFTKKLMSDVKSLERHLNNESNEISGVLRVGLLDSLALTLWPRISQNLKRKYPSLEIKLMTHQSSVLIDRLNMGQLDAVLAVDPKPTQKTYQEEIFRDQFALFSQGSLSKEELGQRALILYSEGLSDYRHSLETMLFELGLSSRTVHEVDSFEVAQRLAQKDLGVAVLPTRLVKEGLSKVDLVPGRSEFGEHRVSFVTHKEGLEQKAVQEVLSEFRVIAATQAKTGGTFSQSAGAHDFISAPVLTASVVR